MHIWKHIEHALNSMSANRLKEDIPEAYFIISCITCAGEFKIMPYLESETFELHCKLVRLDRDFVYELFSKVWEMD